MINFFKWQRLLNIHFFLFFILALSHGYTTINAMNDLENDYPIEDFQDDPEFDPILDTIDFDENPHRANRKLTQDQIAGCVRILNDFNLIPVLQEPIYLKTHTLPLQALSILNIPEIVLFQEEYEHGTFAANLFYAQTSCGKFACDSTRIDSYIGLKDQNLIKAIEDAEQQIKEFLNLTNLDFNVPPILNLFGGMTIQERRGGLFLQMEVEKDRWTFGAKTAIGYAERNFFLSEKEQRAIENANIPGLSSKTSNAQEEIATNRFLKETLAADRILASDIRLNMEYSVIERPRWEVNVGLLLTLPTSFTFKRGLYGGCFERKNIRPNFNICEFLNLALNGTNEDRAEATQIASDFFIGAIRQLSANILEFPGGRHVAIAPEVGVIVNINDYLEYSSLTFIEYQTPADQQRFFIPKRDAAGFAMRNFADESQAVENLEFLNQQFVEKFYPYVLKTRVRPGIHFLTNHYLYATYHRYGLLLGTQFQWIDCEKLGKICAPQELLERLDIHKGIKPRHQILNLYAGLTFGKKTEERDWLFTFAGNRTVHDRGLGKNFNVTFGCEMTF